MSILCKCLYNNRLLYEKYFNRPHAAYGLSVISIYSNGINLNSAEYSYSKYSCSNSINNSDYE